MKKYVYKFGDGKAQGHAKMKELLGGKGANLAEMNLIGIPVPPGFTVTTAACALYNKKGKAHCQKTIEKELKRGVKHLQKIMGKSFGDKKNPLLLSVRSGSRVSMPGMLDTVLNLGLNDKTVEGLSARSGDPQFAWDSYRRLVQMYGDVVMGLKPEKEEEDPFEVILNAFKQKRGVELDSQLTADDLR